MVVCGVIRLVELCGVWMEFWWSQWSKVDLSGVLVGILVILCGILRISGCGVCSAKPG